MFRTKNVLGVAGLLVLGVASGCAVDSQGVDGQEQADAELGSSEQAVSSLHSLGLKRDSDALMSAKRADLASSGLLQAGALPTSVDLSSKLATPGDQGAQGSCVGWATGYGTKTFHEGVELGWSLSTSNHRFSPSWVYNQINGGVDQGAQISNALDLLVSKGDDTLDQFPYTDTNFTNQPNSASFARAVGYRARSWSTLSATASNFKNVLAGGNVVIIGMEVLPDMDALNTTTNTVYDSDAGTSRGGHAVAIVGYDDAKSAFKFINSWGSSWASSGYGWLGYNMLSSAKVGVAAYVLLDAPNRARVLPQDYNGDGYDDQIVFRNGTWFVHPSKGGADLVTPFGVSTDRPIPGDYDGDGKTDVAVFRPSNGTWYAHPTSGGGDIVMQFGVSSDVVVPGDYDGDRKADFAVFRPSSGTWFIRRAAGGADLVTQFGVSTDIPVQGDYDGDGKTDIAVFRPSNGTWYVHKSTGGADLVTQFGVSTDRTIPGDYDGDGKTDVAVFRPSNGTWYVHKSTGGADLVTQFGVSTDRAVPGDYDGDGKTDVAVFRPSNGTWYVHKTTGGADTVTPFGVSSDVIPYSH